MAAFPRPAGLHSFSARNIVREIEAHARVGLGTASGVVVTGVKELTCSGGSLGLTGGRRWVSFIGSLDSRGVLAI